MGTCRCAPSEYANKENEDVLLLADLLGGLLAVVMLLSGMRMLMSKMLGMVFVDLLIKSHRPNVVMFLNE